MMLTIKTMYLRIDTVERILKKVNWMGSEGYAVFFYLAVTVTKYTYICLLKTSEYTCTRKFLSIYAPFR